MSPTPFSSPLATFTGCRFKCNPGTYGSSYTLTDADCTAPCTVGHYCPQGSAAPTPCPLNTYMPTTGASVCTNCPAFATTTTTGATSIAACQCVQGYYTNTDASAATMCSAFPEGSTTAAAGATSLSQCTCAKDRYFSLDATTGVATCPTCPEGSTTAAAGATSVYKCTCQAGRFLSFDTSTGVATCPQCKDVLPSSTSPLAGATSIDACECIQGYFLKTNGTSKSCVACDADLMDCSIPGITLVNMAINKGGWRLSNDTSTIYECFNKEACAGNPGILTTVNSTRRRLNTGTDVSTAGDALCAVGHTGFLCGMCKAGYHGYSDNTLCQDCASSMGIGFVPLIILIVLGLLALTLYCKVINIQTAIGHAEKAFEEGFVNAIKGCIERKADKKMEIALSNVKPKEDSRIMRISSGSKTLVPSSRFSFRCTRF